jgi:hypothetical protein
MSVSIEGSPPENPAAAPLADTYIVRPGYFETMGIPVLGWRGFEPSDGERSTARRIISRKTADEL